jgi:hypothetical protein
MMGGILELYRSLPTHRSPRSGTRLSQPGYPPPELLPDPPRFQIGPGLRFTKYWLKGFAACLIAGSAAILLAFFSRALSLRRADPRWQRSGPCLAAATICLLFMALMSLATYAINPGSTVEVDGRTVNVSLAAASRALGLAAIAAAAVACIELAPWLTGALARRARRRVNS